jgi:hypothetical protein
MSAMAPPAPSRAVTLDLTVQVWGGVDLTLNGDGSVLIVGDEQWAVIDLHEPSGLQMAHRFVGLLDL